MILRAPVRLCFCGQWSDQLAWTGPAAVLNASVTFGEGYPLEYDGRDWRSEIEGVGTGLGISSIRYAVEWLADNPGGDYTAHVLDRERDAGTHGGWQDALGALEPGLKLLTSQDGATVGVEPVDASTIWPYLLVFDSGTRRDSGHINGQVRRAMQDSPAFRTSLRENVLKAKWLAQNPRDPKLWANVCCAGFARLNRIVEMQVPFPASREVFGWIPLGSGGGGYGLAFLRDPGDAAAVIAACREAGVWACQPVLSEGLRIEDSLCERVLPDAPQRAHGIPALGSRARGSSRGQRGGGRNNPRLQGTPAPTAG